MVSWIITRHFLFIKVIYTTIYDLAKSIPPRWEPEIGYYFTRNVHVTFNVLLIGLQVMNFIVRVIFVQLLIVESDAPSCLACYGLQGSL
jgi:hypothetical protein